jgi:hypothetical protein
MNTGTSMRSNPNYNTVVNSYSKNYGFGSNRSIAINIVYDFLISNKFIGNPIAATDIQLYNILIATSFPDALKVASDAFPIKPIISTSMRMDKNYPIIMPAYNPATGFGNHRNTAIVIVGNFMIANGLTGNPQIATDTQLYKILSAPTNNIATEIITSTIPATTMRQDANYQQIILSFNPSRGFGPNRNTAIVIVGKFISQHKININPDRYTDKQLYDILAAPSIHSAIGMILRY